MKHSVYKNEDDDNSPNTLNDKSWTIYFENYNCYLYLPTPPLGQDMTQGQFLSRI